MEIPDGVDEVVERGHLGGALRVELGEEVLAKGFEFLAEVVGDGEVFGGEAVFDSVLRNAGFSFGAGRAGGEQGVRLVRGDLRLSSHKGSFRPEVSMRGGGSPKFQV